jgi:ATP-dependent Clp protease ATP-binding subunit ClpC
LAPAEPGLSDAVRSPQGLPAIRATRAEIPWRRLARTIEARLRRRLVGQSTAIEAVARAVRRAAAGLSDPRGPRATLLFVGPTGSGKTELARALAAELGGPHGLLRVDCGEFGERHETAKLLGAPPGYVGHEAGGVLARGLRAARPAVVLFDEIEKAHGRFHELLLAILDEGRLTDARGDTLDLRRSLVVLTSNAGSRELAAARARVGFAPAAPGLAAESEILRRALEQRFAPEFLGRLDEIVPFLRPTARELCEVAERALLDLAVRVRQSERRVCFSRGVARWIVQQAGEATAGARSVLHGLRREIEGPLAEILLATQPGEWVEVTIRRGRPRFAHAA